MPAEKDLDVPPEEEAYEVHHLPNAEIRNIPDVRGHFAGGGADPVDTALVDRALAELLAERARATSPRPARPHPDRRSPPCPRSSSRSTAT